MGIFNLAYSRMIYAVSLVLISYFSFIIISVYIYKTRIYRVLMFTNVISRQTARKFNHTLRNHKRNLNNNDVIFADFYLWLHLYLGSYITYILLVLISLIRDFILNWWCFHRNMKHVLCIFIGSHKGRGHCKR